VNEATIQRLADVPVFELHFEAWTPDGEWMIFSDFHPMAQEVDLYRFNSADWEFEQLTDGMSIYLFVGWFSDSE
jgi:tricorn protease-like protein